MSSSSFRQKGNCDVICILSDISCTTAYDGIIYFLQAVVLKNNIQYILILCMANYAHGHGLTKRKLRTNKMKQNKNILGTALVTEL